MSKWSAHAGLGDRGVHGAQTGEDAGGVLVVHRHQDRRAGVQLGHRGFAVDAERILGLAQQDHEAGHGGAEPQRQGQEQRGQQGQDDAFQAGHAAQGDGVESGLPAGEAHGDRRQGHDPAAEGHVGDHGAGAARTALPEAKRLDRHGEGHFRRDFDRVTANDLIEGHARGGVHVEEGGAIAHIVSSRTFSGGPGSLRAFRRPLPLSAPPRVR
jgi:hypothetical protein